MYAPVVPSKTIPDSRPKWGKSFQTKKAQKPLPFGRYIPIWLILGSTPHQSIFSSPRFIPSRYFILSPQSAVRTLQSAVHILYWPIVRPICFRKTLYFLVSPWIVELKTSKHKFTDRSHQNKWGFWRQKAQRDGFHCVSTECVPDHGPLAKLHFLFLLPRCSRLSGFLSSRILQNNLLDLYLVQVRRYKLSFFAKAVTVGPTCF